MNAAPQGNKAETVSYGAGVRTAHLGAGLTASHSLSVGLPNNLSALHQPGMTYKEIADAQKAGLSFDIGER